jgi:Holliday junction resolvase RusA-like endonuclease
VIQLYFDTPPTANNFFINVPGRGRAVSQRGKIWRATAGVQLQAQRPKHMPGPVNVEVAVEDAGRFDLDGILKPALDLLVGYGVIEDDNRRVVRDIWLHWDATVKGTMVTISEAP